MTSLEYIRFDINASNDVAAVGDVADNGTTPFPLLSDAVVEGEFFLSFYINVISKSNLKGEYKNIITVSIIWEKMNPI
jgi:hypothetical protein